MTEEDNLIRALGNERESDFVFIVSRLALSRIAPNLSEFPGMSLTAEQREEYAAMDRATARARCLAWLAD